MPFALRRKYGGRELEPVDRSVYANDAAAAELRAHVKRHIDHCPVSQRSSSMFQFSVKAHQRIVSGLKSELRPRFAEPPSQQDACEQTANAIIQDLGDGVSRRISIPIPFGKIRNHE